jgi:hypothetical protein
MNQLATPTETRRRRTEDETATARRRLVGLLPRMKTKLLMTAMTSASLAALLSAPAHAASATPEVVPPPPDSLVSQLASQPALNAFMGKADPTRGRLCTPWRGHKLMVRTCIAYSGNKYQPQGEWYNSTNKPVRFTWRILHYRSTSGWRPCKGPTRGGLRAKQFWPTWCGWYTKLVAPRRYNAIATAANVKYG